MTRDITHYACSLSALAMAVALSSCDQPPAPKTPAPQPTTTADSRFTRGDEPNTSPAAREAEALAKRYMQLLSRRALADAYALWEPEILAKGGGYPAFRDSFAPFARYVGETGRATRIKASEGWQYIRVVASAQLTGTKPQIVEERWGTITLRRSADPNDPNKARRDWRIFGVDLRRRH